MQELIVVGIGYVSSDQLGVAHFQTLLSRSPDLTPVKDEFGERIVSTVTRRDNVTTGEGASFLRFLKTVLTPFIESEYRVDTNNRTLSGHSWGGMFALYTMFHETQLFEKYLAISPALSYGDEVTFSFEEKYHSDHDDLPVRLHLSVGGKEERVPPKGFSMVSDFYRFSAKLRGRKYKSLRLTREVLEECDHGGAAIRGYQSGIQKLFSDR